MRIKFKISKLSNLFFFISNLGEWHFSCRKNYNQIWLRKTGSLTDKEKKYLEKFIKLMKRYGLEYRNNKFMYLGQFFLSPVKNESQIWNGVEKFVKKEDFKLIKKTFSVFKERFEKIWKKDKLQKWQKRLDKEVKSKKFKDLLCKISSSLLYNKNDDNFGISLIGSPDKNRGTAGGANLNSNNITLEIPLSEITEWNSECALGIILHEIAHVFFDKSPLKKKIGKIALLKKMSKINLVIPKRPPEETVKEIILNFIAPFGYFADQYFIDSSSKKNIKRFKNKGREELSKIKNGKKGDLQLIAYYITWKLYPIIASYYKREKPFDEELIKKIINYFK